MMRMIEAIIAKFWNVTEARMISFVICDDVPMAIVVRSTMVVLSRYPYVTVILSQLC